MGKILIINDDPLLLRSMEHIFSSEGFDVATAATGEAGYKRSLEFVPDLVVLDVVLPDSNGFEICKRMKKSKALTNSFIVLASSSLTDSENKVNGLEGGADGYIALPVSNRELVAQIKALLRVRNTQMNLITRTEELEEENEVLEKLAIIDPLTGLWNRRAIFKFAQDEISRSSRESNRVGLAVLDMDHLKTINDIYGHQCGDAALLTFADCLKSSIREYDRVGRIGGDEFILVLSFETEADLKSVINRVFENINNLFFTLPDGKRVAIRASIGIVKCCLEAQAVMDIEEMVKKADEAMYKAKKEGGSRLEFYN